jgi:hypothetical protein
VKRGRCRQCGRGVRARGLFLFETPSGPAYVCGPRCLKRYNGTDVPEEPCPCPNHPPVQAIAPRRRRQAA